MRCVALTFDTEFPDRPCVDPLGNLRSILELLSANRIRATFFVVGCWARTYPAMVIDIAKAGHEIGIHGYSHADLRRMTAKGIIDELTEAHRVLSELGLETRPLFRAPFGGVSNATIDMDAAFGFAGYEHTGWDAHGDDWDGTRSVEEIVQDTIRGIHGRWPKYAVALFHSWPDRTPAALRQVLITLGDADFLTVGSLA